MLLLVFRLENMSEPEEANISTTTAKKHHSIAQQLVILRTNQSYLQIKKAMNANSISNAYCRYIILS